MKHLTISNLYEYLQIDIDNYSTEEAALMNMVYQHTMECDQCFDELIDMSERHAFAEFIVGKPIPLRKEPVLLLDAINSKNIAEILDSALEKISGSINELNSSAANIVQNMLSKGYEQVYDFSAAFMPMQLATRGGEGQAEQAALTVDSESATICLPTSGEVILTVNEEADAVVVVGINGEHVEAYELTEFFGIRTATTNKLPEGTYYVMPVQIETQGDK